ncbi:MAG: phasin family protein [Hyphomicrobium sp.]|jgi:phasin
MSDKPQFEFPEAVRELAERNVEQARNAYNQFLDMARKVQETLTASQGAMTSSAAEMQSQVSKFAEQNIQASFAFATELSQARDLKDYMEIQQRYAQKQMQAFAHQAHVLGRLVAETAQKTQPR